MKKNLEFFEINEIAKKLAMAVKENTVIALNGELGTGKTNFVKNFAKELGVKENLKSPTFNYYLEYKSGRLPLFHFDVYRLEKSSEIYELGFEDCINSGGVTLIEWADNIKMELPKDYIEITFWHVGQENKREIEIKSIGKIFESEVRDVGFRN
ncbi:MAG: tRNA (adenosine(37)-N6)-threonylcarbamoyltransferase complex ATPase subunit type 1 TsaE [Fusobacteriaceae bacterium]